MLNEKIANLNQVEGFNPEDYARIISDDSGENPRKYLDVMWRKVWFYLKYPNGIIRKSIVNITNAFVIVEAKVYFDKNDPEENYAASGLAQRWFKQGDVFGERAIETAETGAEGRALANAGFGLQYCCDIQLEKNGDIVDAPIPQKSPENTGTSKAADNGNKPTENESKEKAPAATVGKTPEAGQKKATNNAGNAASPQVKTPANPVSLKAPIGLMVNTQNNAENLSEVQTDDSGKIEKPAENTAQEENPVNSTEIIIDTGTPEEPETVIENNQDGQEKTPDSESGTEQGVKYDNSMEATEIVKLMTLNEAAVVEVDFGKNKGKMISEIAGDDPNSLEWYFTKYNGKNNILRAAAMITNNYITDLMSKKAV